MDFLIVALVIIINASHVWSLKKHFAIDEIPKGAKVLIAINISCSVALLILTFFVQQPFKAQVTGITILIASLVIFWITIAETRKANLLAAFDENLPHRLVTTGPYQYVRHPFYTSYILLWFGWAVSTWHLIAIFPAAIMFIVFWSAARDEEAKFEKTEMAESYKAFKKRTGRFFPKFF